MSRFIVWLCLISIFPLVTFSQSKTLKKETFSSEKETNVVKTSEVQTNSISPTSSPVSTNTSSTFPDKKEMEYIEVGKREKGFKIYLEAGGGPMVNGGLIWRPNSIFGVGIGVGYTPLPYKNYGVSLNIKTETIPVWFDLNFMKINMIVGLNGIFFFGSGTQYVGAIAGVEFLFKAFQYLVPSFNTYLYLAGESIIPQLSFQLRYCF